MKQIISIKKDITSNSKWGFRGGCSHASSQIKLIGINNEVRLLHRVLSTPQLRLLDWTKAVVAMVGANKLAIQVLATANIQYLNSITKSPIIIHYLYCGEETRSMTHVGWQRDLYAMKTTQLFISFTSPPLFVSRREPTGFIELITWEVPMGKCLSGT